MFWGLRIVVLCILVMVICLFSNHLCFLISMYSPYCYLIWSCNLFCRHASNSSGSKEKNSMGMLYDLTSQEGFAKKKRRSIIPNMRENSYLRSSARFREIPAFEDLDSDWLQMLDVSLVGFLLPIMGMTCLRDGAEGAFLKTCQR